MEDTICAVSTAPGAGGIARHPHLRTGSNRNLQHDIRTAYSREKACCHRKPIHCVTVVSGVVKSS